MKKMILMSTLLLMACMVQAQIVKVSPTLKKGDVKTYLATSNIKASGQDLTVTINTTYTVTEVTADGYVIDVLNSNMKVNNAESAVSRLLVAATEMVNEVNFKLITDKSGQVKSIKNYEEVKAKITAGADKLIDGMLKDMPELGQVLSKEQLKEQLMGAVTEDALIKSMCEGSVLTLNGKSIASGAQDEYVNSQGMKMKRFYLVNGNNKISSTATMNMTQDDMKKMIIEKVEQMAPEQAQMVKDNIDTLLESGMLKAEGSEKANYELGADGWVKTMTVENNVKLMGQESATTTTITRQ